MQYPFLLNIAFPIFLGALIGYVTNAIAIRMLFRPLNEYRIGAFRVPFTPGVIPRQRHQLARSIARMVSRELLTEGTFRKRLEDPLFQKRVYERLSDLSDRLFSTPLGSLMDAVPIQVRGLGVSFLRTVLREALDGERISTSSIPGESGSIAPTSIPARPFRNLLEETLEQIWEIPVPAHVPEGILRWIRESEGGKRFIQRIRQFTELKIQEGVTIGKLLGIEVRAERMYSVLEPLYPKIGSFLVQFLRTPEVKRELEIEGRFLLREILSELSFFQRLWITAGQYDRTLEERMPFIVEDVIQAIERATGEGPIKEKILKVVMEELDRLIDQPILIWYEKAGREWIETFWKILEHGMEHGLPEIFGSILLPRGERDIRIGVWVSYVVGIPRKELTSRTLDWIRRWIVSEGDLATGKRSPIGEELLSIFQKMWSVPKKVLGAKSLGDLFPLTKEEKDSIDLFLIRTIFDILSAKLPIILTALDIEDLVTKRIDELDIREVEELLLSVISRHLRWINVVGGVLGAIIGATQVLVQYIK
ncbi:MAG: DUF445 family protein [Spirochaetes bacterium]|nr:DUF445 family protein [Spirochaetota bacterium]